VLRERELHLPRLVVSCAIALAASGAWSQEPSTPPAAQAEEPKPEPKKKEASPAEPEAAKASSPSKKEHPAPPDEASPAPSTPEPSKKRAAAEPAAASPEPSKSKAETRTPEDDLTLVARQFFGKLLKRDITGATAFCKTPFFFEGKAVNTPEEVRKRWAGAVSSRAVERIVLYGIDVLTPEEMAKKYGDAPSKLTGWPMKGGMITVANLSGQAAVVLWKKNNNVWSAIGYHD
jgi:hypothetical protein